MGKPSVPEAPDYSEIMAAAQASAEMANQIAQDQLDWAKVTYEDNQAIIEPIMASYQQTLDFTQATAEANQARYEEVYQPLEDQLIAEAASYASPERLELEMGRAQAGVAQSMEAARQASAQELKSYGINPASPAYAGFDIAERTAQAATTVQAGEQAYQQTQAKADALRSEALNIGKGYPGMISSSYNTALAAGSQAVGGTNQTTATASSAMTAPANYMNTANNSLDVWGNTLNNSYNNQMSQYNAQMAQASGTASAIGSVTGLVMPFVYSSMGVPSAYVAEGGEIMPRQSYAPGGAVPVQQSPSSGARVDDVPAQLTAGEFVVPEDVVRWKGSEYFYKELEKARQKRMEMATPSGSPIPQPKVPAGATPGGMARPHIPEMPAPTGARGPQQSMGHHPMPRPTPPMPGMPGRPTMPYGGAPQFQSGGYVQAVPAAPVRMQLGGLPPVDPSGQPMESQPAPAPGAYMLQDGTWIIPPVSAAQSAQVPTPMVPMSSVNQPAYAPAYSSPGKFDYAARQVNPPTPQSTAPPVMGQPGYAPGRTNYASPGSAFASGVAGAPTRPAFGMSGNATTAGGAGYGTSGASSYPVGRYPPQIGSQYPQSPNAPRGGMPSSGFAGAPQVPAPFTTSSVTQPARIPQPRPSGGAQARTARKPKARPSDSKAKKGKKRTPIIKENPPYSMSAFEFARQGQDYLNRNKPKRAKRGAVDVFNSQAGYPSVRSK